LASVFIAGILKRGVRASQGTLVAETGEALVGGVATSAFAVNTMSFVNVCTTGSANLNVNSHWSDAA
jgi:hypothetical protein